jgi:MEDS: MEthanogen/methylotroph, DcmR Sensory domain
LAAVNLDDPLAGLIDGGWCPHLAMLLRGPEEVAPTLASFYALGAARNAWLFHRALLGSADADRAALSAAGLDVAGLERERRMTFGEVTADITVEQWVESWEPELDRALERGFGSAWWARFPIGPDEAIIQRSVEYDQAWDERFHDRPCVSLCLFIVGDIDPPAEEERIALLAATHDGVLVERDEGTELVRTPGR